MGRSPLFEPVGEESGVSLQGRQPRGRSALVAFVLASVAVGSLACSVGAQHRADLISKKDVPFGLLEPASTSTSLPSGRKTELLTIYLDVAGRLVPVNRQVPGPVTVADALIELTMGPTGTEASLGMESPVAAATPLTYVGRHNGVVSVSTGAAFANMGGQDQIIAAAQIVFTITAFPGVSGVLLLVGKQPTQVPDQTGKLVQGALTTSDYNTLAPF